MTQDEIQAVALKPCPFCGNDGSGPIEHALHVSHTQNDWHSAYDCYSVQCDKCTVSMGYSDNEAEAIAAWNTRADAAPTPKADEVEAVGFAMWKADADRAAPNVGKNRTIENYRYDLDPIGRAKWDQIAQAAIAALDAARGKAEPSIWPGLDHIANYINSLDTEGMSGLEVRKAIYRQCIQPGKLTPDAARGDPVARVVAYLYEASETEGKRAEDNKGTDLGRCAAYAAMALRQEASLIERGEPFNAAPDT